MNHKIGLTEPFEVPEKILMQDLDGETVLLNLDNGHYYGLNEIGTDVWGLLAAGKTVEECIAALKADYEVQESVLQEDIVALVSDLFQQGLVLKK